MTLSIIVILFIGLIGYFQYTQGFFSATLSAVFTVIAAVLAVSYDEPVVRLIVTGKSALADEAHPMILCAIFAVTYILLRIVFDKAVPGNVRTPSTVDKIGAGLMGVVAGIFATGIFAIAVQMLPFGPTTSLMGYTRYEVKDEPYPNVFLPVGGNQPMLNTHIDNRLTDSTFNPEKLSKLWVPVDDIVMNTVYHLSDGGSMAGDFIVPQRPMASIHPDYLQELFGERLGIQTGGQRSALQSTKSEPIAVDSVYDLAGLTGYDGEAAEIRGAVTPPAGKPLPPPTVEKPADKNAKVEKPLTKYEVKPNRDQRLLVVRIKVGDGATSDADGVFRFSTGSIRMVVKTADGYRDFHPVGVMENSQTVLLNSLDDFLFLPKGKAGFDAVFLVDQSALTGGKTSNAVADGTFISVKRYAVMDLSGTKVQTTYAAQTDYTLERTKVLQERLNLPPASEAASAPAAGNPSKPADVKTSPTEPPKPAQPAAPVKRDLNPVASVSADLPFRIGSGATGPSDANVTVVGGTVSLTDGAISVAQIEPADSLDALAAGGGTPLQKLYAPAGHSVLQVTVSLNGGLAGLKQNLASTSLTDTNNNAYSPNGFFVRDTNNDKLGLLMNYDANSKVATIRTTSTINDAPESTVTFLFVVAEGTTAKSITVGGDSAEVK